MKRESSPTRHPKHTVEGLTLIRPPLTASQKATLGPEEKCLYDWDIQYNLRERLGREAYYSYTMMDGEAMRYQNEAKKVIPSKVFEIR